MSSNVSFSGCGSVCAHAQLSPFYLLSTLRCQSRDKLYQAFRSLNFLRVKGRQPERMAWDGLGTRLAPAYTASRAGCWLRPQSYRWHKVLISSTAARVASKHVSWVGWVWFSGCGSVVAHAELSCFLYPHVISFTMQAFLSLNFSGKGSTTREDSLGTRLLFWYLDGGQ